MIFDFSTEIDCRYLRRELVAKGAIFEQNLPQYLAAWVDKSSDLCIFKASHMKAWPLEILQSCPWFLECPLNFCTAEEEKEKYSVGDNVPNLKLTPLEVVGTMVSEFGGKRKRGSKKIVTPSQENVASGTCGTKEPVVSITCASDDYVDLAQYNNCIHTTGISTKETLSHTYAQVMLENTFVFNIVTGASQIILLKTNEFVKQVSILPIFIFLHFIILEGFLFDILLRTILIGDCCVQQFDSVRSTHVSNDA